MLAVGTACACTMTGGRRDDGERFSLLALPAPDETALRPLTAEQVRRDTSSLATFLKDGYSYLTLKGVALDEELAALQKACAKGTTRGELAIAMTKMLARFGDGHTAVQIDLGEIAPAGCLPFLVQESSGRLVAFRGDRSDFLDASDPFVTEFDGIPIERWLDAASAFVARGSRQYVRWHSIRTLRFAQLLRREMGGTESMQIAVTLESEDRARRTTIELPLEARRAQYGEWPRRQCALLDGNVGYLRISEMDDSPEFLASLAEWMGKFRETAGLIIDVRGNGGGKRDALRTLFPYFMAPGDPPHVANVAAYRYTPRDERGRRDGYLWDRFLHPVTASCWSAEARRAIERFAKTFRPKGWAPDPARFSPWHFLVLERTRDDDVYHYSKPVVILMDPGCFSATDVFLAAFRGWRNVTLMGTPSGGGSGRAQRFGLEESGLVVSASSMASFRRDGMLLDGNGVEPDVLVVPIPTDLIGRTDRVLDAALFRVHAK